jgi:pimeloyl-ACP methyl ester carboxylesterase
LAALVLLLVAGSIYESSSEAADAKAYPPPGQMVDVGGYRLHINCTGSGSPTVVIDAGLGEWSTMWALVQPDVAKTTRVCTYDRAGLGWSEAGPLPRDAAQMATELNALLQNADIPGPYVMVAHSLGGLPAQVFAHDHPSEVAGVVLIDSMFPGQTIYFSPPKVLSVLPTVARFGIVRLLAGPLHLVDAVPGSEAAQYSLSVGPKFVQAYLGEAQAIPTSLAEAGAVTSLGDLPLIVLSRGLDPAAEWQAGQLKLVGLSSNSQHLIAEKSGHNIELSQPEAAVAAINQMVQKVRAGAAAYLTR